MDVYTLSAQYFFPCNLFFPLALAHPGKPGPGFCAFSIELSASPESRPYGCNPFRFQRGLDTDYEATQAGTQRQSTAIA